MTVEHLPSEMAQHHNKPAKHEFKFAFQINRVIVRAEGSEAADRAVYELEACLPVESQVMKCIRSAITVYAIPDPIGMNHTICMIVVLYITII